MTREPEPARAPSDRRLEHRDAEIRGFLPWANACSVPNPPPSAARYEALLEHSSDATLLVDLEGRIVFMSPEVERRYGWTFEDLAVASFEDVFDTLYHPQDKPIAQAVVADVMTAPRLFTSTTVEPIVVTLRLRTRGGGWRWAEIRVSNRVADPAVRGYVLNVRDVDDVVEDRRNLASETDALFRYRVSPDMAYEYVSPSVRYVLGYEPGVFYEDGYFHETFVHPDDLGAVDVLTDPFLRRDSTRFRIEHGRGGERWIELRTVDITDSRGNVVALEGRLRDVTMLVAEQHRLAHRALHDAITDLPNRAYFIEQARELVRERSASGDALVGRSIAVYTVSVDRMARVNEQLGIGAGDTLLHSVGRCLLAATSSGDLVARLDGDVFGVAIADVETPVELVRKGQALRAAASHSYELAHHNGAGVITDTVENAGDAAVGRLAVNVTASVGAALVASATTDAADTVARAESAARLAKSRGGNAVEVFDPTLRDLASMELEKELELQRAIDNDELELLYQPIVVLDTGCIVGVEALIRWQHPDRGLLMPAEFLPVALSSGAIVDLDDWVLRTASAQAVAWAEMGLDPRVRVNVSALEFADAHLPGRVRRALQDTGCAPEWIILEITETAMMQDEDICVSTMRVLKALGVGLSIDDFGTGYSSLSHIREFPIDTLKIDRSFVGGLDGPPDDPGAVAIVSASIQLGSALGLGVIAEGVETLAQRDRLLDLGCRHAQGFLFAKPLPAYEIMPLVETGSTAG